MFIASYLKVVVLFTVHFIEVHIMIIMQVVEVRLKSTAVPTAAIGLEASSSTDFSNELYNSNLNSFLSELYFKSSSEGVDKYSLLSMLFDRVERAFVSRDLVEIDKLLEAFEPSKTLDVVSVGVLRSTFRAKARLKSWQGCLARVIKYMDDSGLDWKRQLRGLINPHDTFLRINYSAVL